VQGEARFGILGESAYSQFGLAIGLLALLRSF